MSGQRVIIEADGGSRGNPGPAGWGAAVRDAETGEVLLERSGALGTATNNVAEYQGLIGGLEAAAELGATEVEARMDSKLVVEQMSGRWQIKHPGLRPLAARAAALARQFGQIRWTWVPRDRNTHADRLANEAMDRAAGGDSGQGSVPQGSASQGSASRGTGGSGAGSGSGSGWAPPTGTPTRLILIRHGETERTVQGRYSGRTDVDLTSRGRAQALAAGARVVALAPKVTAVVSSPLRRCRETAAMVASELGDPPVVIEDDLIECDFGAWEGRTFQEVQQRWSSELAEWLGSTRVAPPGGESFQQVAKRVRGVDARLRETYPPGSTVVVVSHVSPLKLLLRDWLAAGDGFLHRLFLDPAGVSVVDRYADGALAVRTVNDTSHLR